MLPALTKSRSVSILLACGKSRPSSIVLRDARVNVAHDDKCASLVVGIVCQMHRDVIHEQPLWVSPRSGGDFHRVATPAVVIWVLASAGVYMYKTADLAMFGFVSWLKPDPS